MLTLLAYLQQGNVKKSKKLIKIVNTGEENLHIFQMKDLESFWKNRRGEGGTNWLLPHPNLWKIKYIYEKHTNWWYHFKATSVQTFFENFYPKEVNKHCLVIIHKVKEAGHSLQFAKTEKNQLIYFCWYPSSCWKLLCRIKFITILIILSDNTHVAGVKIKPSYSSYLTTITGDSWFFSPP